MDRRSFLKRAAGASVAAAAGAAIAPIADLATQQDPAKAVLWPFKAPVLDQGQIGSCTGNAVTQWSNTEYARAITKRKAFLTEPDAVNVYKLATKLDGLPGEYPGMNTGSTGDAACDAAVQLGYLAGYMNVQPKVEAIIAALRKQPLIVASKWLSGMMTPDKTGLVKPTGYVSGGHEYVLLGFDTTAGLFECLNSWSDKWGAQGRFRIRCKDLVGLVGIHDTWVTAPLARDY